MRRFATLSGRITDAVRIRPSPIDERHNPAEKFCEDSPVNSNHPGRLPLCCFHFGAPVAFSDGDTDVPLRRR